MQHLLQFKHYFAATESVAKQIKKKWYVKARGKINSLFVADISLSYIGVLNKNWENKTTFTSIQATE